RDNGALRDVRADGRSVLKLSKIVILKLEAVVEQIVHLDADSAQSLRKAIAHHGIEDHETVVPVGEGRSGRPLDVLGDQARAEAGKQAERMKIADRQGNADGLKILGEAEGIACEV